MKKWIYNYPKKYSEELADIKEDFPLSFTVGRVDMRVSYSGIIAKDKDDIDTLRKRCKEYHSSSSVESVHYCDEQNHYIVDVELDYPRQKVTKKWVDEIVAIGRYIQDTLHFETEEDSFMIDASVCENRLQLWWSDIQSQADEVNHKKFIKDRIDESGVLWLHDYPEEERDYFATNPDITNLSDILHYDFSFRFEYFVGDSDDDDESDKITKKFVKAVRAETNCIVKNRYGLVVITTPPQRLQKETFLDAKKQLDEIAERYDGGEDGWHLLRKNVPKIRVENERDISMEECWASTIGEDHEEAFNLLTQDNLPLLDETEFDMSFVLRIPEKKVAAVQDALAAEAYDNINIGDSQGGAVQIEVSLFEARVTKEFYLGTIAKLTQLAEAYGGEYDGWFGFVSDD